MMKMANDVLSPQGSQRFGNMLAIAGIEIDHSEIQQMIAGEAQRLDAACCLPC